MKDIQQAAGIDGNKELNTKGAERNPPKQYQRKKDPRSLTQRSFDAWQERLKKEDEVKQKQGKG